jgi:hypothetical protein
MISFHVVSVFTFSCDDSFNILLHNTVRTLSEIHQVDPNRYFGKASFLLDPLDPGGQHLAGVQQAGKGSF